MNRKLKFQVPIPSSNSKFQFQVPIPSSDNKFQFQYELNYKAIENTIVNVNVYSLFKLQITNFKLQI